MRRIAERTREIPPRQAALILAVAALAAAAAYFGAREVTRGQTNPLTLTLTTASQICETEQAIEYGGARQWKDEDGNWQI